MTVKCTNPNLKTAQTAHLEQPAPKLKLDQYIPQTQQSKIKKTFVIRRQKGINGELQEKKLAAHHLTYVVHMYACLFKTNQVLSNSVTADALLKIGNIMKLPNSFSICGLVLGIYILFLKALFYNYRCSSLFTTNFIINSWA